MNPRNAYARRAVAPRRCTMPRRRPPHAVPTSATAQISCDPRTGRPSRTRRTRRARSYRARHTYGLRDSAAVAAVAVAVAAGVGGAGRRALPAVAFHVAGRARTTAGAALPAVARDVARRVDPTRELAPAAVARDVARAAFGTRERAATLGALERTGLARRTELAVPPALSVPVGVFGLSCDPGSLRRTRRRGSMRRADACRQHRE